MARYDSPKRKRSTPPADSQFTDTRSGPDVRLRIPLTPPRSSPSKTDTDSGMRHTTSINGVQVLVPEDATGSPRTKVAYHFQGLQLEDGGDVSKLSLDLQRAAAPKPVPKSDVHFGEDGTDESIVRKRMRVLEGQDRGSRDARRKVQ
jgi:hypothetical protein